MRKHLFSLVVVVALGLVACNKNEAVLENTPAKHKAPVAKNIRVFNSFDEVSAEIDKTLSMSFEELVAYEASIGFNSFGKLADMAYNEVAQYQDEYTSIEEVRNAMANHSQYLQLIEDEKGDYSLETKLYERATKYIVNHEKMYQVKDTLILILDSITIEAGIGYYEEMLKITNGGDIPDKFVDAGHGYNQEDIHSGDINRPSPCYIGKYQPNVHEREKVQVGNHKRDHKLTVIVKIDDIGGNKEEPRYIFETRRKGISNRCWWAYDADITFDLTVITGITVGGYLYAWGYPVYKNGTVRTNGYYSRYTGNFLKGYQPDYLDSEDSEDNVFVKTSGYARCYPDLYVPFDFGCTPGNNSGGIFRLQ